MFCRGFLLELRHCRRAFVSSTHRVALAFSQRTATELIISAVRLQSHNSCFASDFVDDIQRASAPTFGWIRGSLSILHIVPAMATFLCRAKRQVDYADIRNLPCIMPFGEGFLPTITLNHSLRRLVIGLPLCSAKTWGEFFLNFLGYGVLGRAKRPWGVDTV